MTFASMAALRAALMTLAEKPPGKAFVAYLKEQLPQKAASWWNCCSAHNWLRYNMGSQLNIVALHLSSVSYYILVDNAFVQEFRKIKFGKK